MAILTNAGRAAVALAIKGQTIHLAWGAGDPDWDTSPEAVTGNETALVDEIGRRVVSEAQYVVPDAEGSINVPPGRFEVSLIPTKYLYLRFSFDFNDAPTADIRELGVFVGTTLKPGVPAGTEYVTPTQVQSPGQLLLLERIDKLERSSSIRQRFEYVVQF